MKTAQLYTYNNDSIQIERNDEAFFSTSFDPKI